MIDANSIVVSVLNSTDGVHDFRCEKQEYSDFLASSDGAIGFQKKNLAVTYLFRSHSSIIGFITLAITSLRKPHAQEKSDQQEVNEIPSLLLTHIARDLRYKAKGVGKIMMDWTINFANELAATVGCRFIVIEIPQEMITLFQRFGFELLPPDKNDRHYVMFFDLGLREIK